MRAIPLTEIQVAGGWGSILMVQRYAHLQPDSVAKSPRFDLPFTLPKGKVVEMWEPGRAGAGTQTSRAGRAGRPRR